MRFFEARALRIFPALILACVLASVVIGPLTTTLPIREYFNSSETLHSIPCTVFLSPHACNLPGVFTSNPIPFGVNGSLWTISVEIALYGILAIASTIGLFRNRLLALSFLALLVACEYRWSHVMLGWMPHSGVMTSHLAGTFIAGSIIYWIGNRLPVSLVLGVVFAGLAIVTFDSRWFAYFLLFAIAYWTLYLGFFAPLWKQRLPWEGDYSYGLYVFAFLIQQALVDVLGIRSPLLLFCISFPLTLLLAILSWHFVESKALQCKGRLLSIDGLAGRIGTRVSHALALAWRHRRTKPATVGIRSG